MGGCGCCQEQQERVLFEPADRRDRRAMVNPRKTIGSDVSMPASKVPPEGLVFPEIETPAHAADLGLIFFKGNQFPEKYQGGIFFAQHGSWNRTVPIGARISFATLNPDGTSDKAEVFAEGWLRQDGSYAGRPSLQQ